MRWLQAVLILLACAVATPTLAVSPEEVLANPVLEQRARDISGGLRCLVCQNQSIDDSDADLAKDLRVLVRERLVAGDTDDAVRQYLVDRYGEYVLLNPRMNMHTLVLWIAAPVLLLVGLGTLWFAGRRRKTARTEGLTSDEQQALDSLRND